MLKIPTYLSSLNQFVVHVVGFKSLLMIGVVVLAGCSLTPASIEYKEALEKRNYTTLSTMDTKGFDSLQAYLNQSFDPIHYAISENDEALLKYLLKSQNVTLRKNNKGQSPLFHAIDVNTSFNIIQKLIAAGADPYESFNGVTALQRGLNSPQNNVKQFFENKQSVDNKFLISARSYIELGRFEQFASILTDSPLSSLALKQTNLLNEAIRLNRHQIVEYLIKLGADINRIDAGNVPIVTAMRLGNAKVVGHILVAKPDLNIVTNGMSLMQLAVSPNPSLTDDKQAQIVTLMIGAGADVNARTGTDKRPPVYIATINSRFRTLAALLKGQADVNLASEDGMTSVTHAIHYGKLNILKRLLKSKPNVHYRDAQGRSLLHWIFHLKNEESDEKRAALASILLRAGASLNSRNKLGYTPFHLAIKLNHKLTAHTLYRAGADVNLPNKDGITPLMHMSSEGSHNDLMKMLEFNPDPYVTQKNGRTALHMALQSVFDEQTLFSDCVQNIPTLISLGLSVNQQDALGFNALHYLANMKSLNAEKPHIDRTTIAQILIDAQIALDARTQEQFTALMLAASSGSFQLVEFLVNSGADATLMNAKFDNKTAADFARENDHDEIADFLLEYENTAYKLNPEKKISG